MTPSFSSRSEFDALYAELLAAAHATHWTEPDEAAYAMGPRDKVDQLFEVGDVLWMFADIYDLNNDDVLDAFSKFTYAIMVCVLDKDSAIGAITAALLNARDVHLRQGHDA